MMKMNRNMAFLAFACLAFSLQSWAAETVLVISGDEPGYREVADGFKSAFSGDFSEINLEGSDDKVRKLGAQMEASPPGLAVVVGDLAAQFAKWYLKGVPLIYCDAEYAAKISLTKEKAVGIYHEPDPVEQIKIMHEVFPEKTRVAVLYSAEYARMDKGAIQMEAGALGLDLEYAPMASIKEMPAKLRDVMAGKELLWIFTDPVIFNDISIQYIVVQAITSRIPIFCGDKTLARLGATAALAPDMEDAGIKAAKQAEEILKGSAPSAGVIVYPGGRIILSQKMASLMNISFPPSISGRASDVVK